MDKDVAIAFQNKLRIAVDRIVREEYEMILLQDILGSSFGKMLVFRGGTAKEKLLSYAKRFPHAILINISLLLKNM